MKMLRFVQAIQHKSQGGSTCRRTCAADTACPRMSKASSAESRASAQSNSDMWSSCQSRLWLTGQQPRATCWGVSMDTISSIWETTLSVRQVPVNWVGSLGVTKKEHQLSPLMHLKLVSWHSWKPLDNLHPTIGCWDLLRNTVEWVKHRTIWYPILGHHTQYHDSTHMKPPSVDGQIPKVS